MRTSERWNRLVKRQPKLKKFVLSIEQDPHNAQRPHTDNLYALTTADARFFDNPSLTRMRLSWLNITAFEDLPEGYFSHSSLHELDIERSSHTLASLSRLFRPCKTLTRLRLYCAGDTTLSAADEANFISTLESFAGQTLKILDLSWVDLKPKEPDTWSGWELSRFTALRHCRVSPFFLFGMNAYTGDTPSQDLVSLLRRTLPPRVKWMSFDSMMPLGLTETLPEGVGYVLGPATMNLLRTMITYMGQDGFAMCLTRIFVFYCEHLARVPEDLLDLAREKGARLGFLHQEDQEQLVGVDLEWLDADGNDDAREDHGFKRVWLARK